MNAEPDEWNGIVQKVMELDNSWNNTAGKYIEVYNSVRVRLCWYSTRGMLHQRHRNQLSSCLRFSDVPHGAMLLLWNEAQDKKEGRETRKHTIKQLH